MNKILPVILSGGEGKRMVPLSSPKFPKQFLTIDGTEPLVINSIKRFLSDEFAAPLILANLNNETLLEEILAGHGVSDFKAIYEPEAKNTGPAICVATLFVEKFYGADTIIVIAPSDHFIGDNKKFAASIRSSVELAKQNKIVCLGIKPNYPNSNYGYIKKGNSCGINDNCYNIEEFVEKPDVELAASFVSSEKYLWNSGIYVSRVSVIAEEYMKVSEDIYELSKMVIDDPLFKNDSLYINGDIYSRMPTISFDYTIMEKNLGSSVVEVDFEWSDLGSIENFKKYSK